MVLFASLLINQHGRLFSGLPPRCIVHVPAILRSRLTGSPDRLEYDSVEDLTGVSDEPILWYHSHIQDRLYINLDPIGTLRFRVRSKYTYMKDRSIFGYRMYPMFDFCIFLAPFPRANFTIPRLLGLWWHRFHCAASDVPWLSHTQGIYLWLHCPSMTYVLCIFWFIGYELSRYTYYRNLDCTFCKDGRIAGREVDGEVHVEASGEMSWQWCRRHSFSSGTGQLRLQGNNIYVLALHWVNAYVRVSEPRN